MLASSGYLTPIFSVLSPLISAQSWISERTGIQRLLGSPRDMATLREENMVLRKEVAQLQSEIIALQENWLRLKFSNLIGFCPVTIQTISMWAAT